MAVLALAMAVDGAVAYFVLLVFRRVLETLVEDFETSRCGPRARAFKDMRKSAQPESFQTWKESDTTATNFAVKREFLQNARLEMLKARGAGFFPSEIRLQLHGYTHLNLRLLEVFPGSFDIS